MEFDAKYSRYFKSQVNYLHGEFGGIYKIFPSHVDLSAYYRVVTNKEPNLNKMEQRFYFNINLKDQINKIELENKIGFECRDRKKTHNISFLKNKLTISYTLESSGSSAIKPYLADEILLDINSKDAHRNRFYLGIFSDHNKSLFADFYYYLESFFKRFNQSIKYQHVFGVKITFFIPHIKQKQPKVTVKKF